MRGRFRCGRSGALLAAIGTAAAAAAAAVAAVAVDAALGNGGGDADIGDGRLCPLHLGYRSVRSDSCLRQCC